MKKNNKYKKNILKVFGLLFFALWTSSSMCTKVVVFGTDTTTDVVSHVYSSNLVVAMEQSRKALENLGYQISSADDQTYHITTGWKPTKSDSHYLDLFQRRDYGANAGCYYQLNVVVTEEGAKVRVAVSTVVKSVSGKLKSSHVVENTVLARIDDYMRSPQIEMTNVGVTER